MISAGAGRLPPDHHPVDSGKVGADLEQVEPDLPKEARYLGGLPCPHLEGDQRGHHS